MKKLKLTKSVVMKLSDSQLYEVRGGTIVSLIPLMCGPERTYVNTCLGSCDPCYNPGDYTQDLEICLENTGTVYCGG